MLDTNDTGASALAVPANAGIHPYQALSPKYQTPEDTMRKKRGAKRSAKGELPFEGPPFFRSDPSHSVSPPLLHLSVRLHNFAPLTAPPETDDSPTADPLIQPCTIYPFFSDFGKQQFGTASSGTPPETIRQHRHDAPCGASTPRRPGSGPTGSRSAIRPASIEQFHP